MKTVKNIFRFSFVIIFLFLIGYIIGYLRYNNPPQMPKTVEDDPALPSIEINGHLLHLELFGDTTNPMILAIHDGPGGDYRSMLNLKSLSDSFFIVLYDQQGTGLSARTDDFNELSVENAVSDIYAIVNKFSSDRKVHFVGNGWGSLLSCEFTYKYPKHVDKLILADPPFLTDQQAEIFFTRTQGFRSPLNKTGLSHLLKSYFLSVHIKEPDNHAAKDFFMYSLMHQPYQGFPLSGYYCTEGIPETSVPFQRGGALLAQTQINRLLDQKGQFNIPYQFKTEKIKNPTLILTGACNNITGKSFQQKHLPLFTNVNVVEVNNSGHYLFVEQQENTLKFINNFIGQK